MSTGTDFAAGIYDSPAPPGRFIDRAAVLADGRLRAVGSSRATGGEIGCSPLRGLATRLEVLHRAAPF